MKNCPKCNNEHNKPGIFCSRTCANSRIWTDEINLKRSISAKNTSPWNKGITTGSNEKRNAAIKEARQESTKKKFLSGLLTERSAIRRHISREYGYNCAVCNISDWQGQLITLQVDHIDGNAGNNSPENLRLICPNCHSQTKTFSGRNKGSGRAARGLPLH
jgi:5-methylcytosine-specific restriction endonuclease McrA